MELITCPYCGALLEKECERCPYCGQQLETKSEGTKPIEHSVTTTQNNKNNEWIQKWKNKQFGEHFVFPVILTTLILGLMIFMIWNFMDEFGYKGPDGILWVVIIMCSLIFLVLVIAVFGEFTSRKFVVKKVDGFTILAAKYGRHNFLVVDDKVLDDQHYDATRYWSNMRVLTANLPNGKHVWVEFRPEIVIHIGNDRVNNK